MTTINDVEYKKFDLLEGEVIIKTKSVEYGDEIPETYTIDDLEKLKFDENGDIRIVAVF